MARWWLVVLAGLGACSFDPNLAPSAVVACSADSPACPPGYSCQLALGRCLSTADVEREAPRVLDAEVPTSPLRRGATLEVRFTASEALSVPPVAVLALGGRSVPLALTERAAPRFTFSHVVDATDVEGTGPVSVDLVDVFGNVASGVPLGAVTFDFTPPEVSQSSFLTPPEAGGASVEVTPSQRVSVRLVFTEALAPGAALRATSPCGALDFVRAPGSASILDFTATDGGQHGCEYQLGVAGAVDLAGNALPAAAEALGKSFRVDGLAPVLGAVETGRAADGGFARTQTFSRVSGFDEVLLRFVVSDDAAAVAAFFDGEAVAGCERSACVPGDGGLACLCRRAVRATDTEGDRLVAVSAADRAGNARTQGAAVRFDFTPPGLLPGTLQRSVEPPASSPTRSASALTAGSLLRVAFATTEAGGAVLDAGPGIAFAPTAISGASFSFVGTAAVGLPEGPRELSAELTDVVGNVAQVALPAPILVDTSAPAAPETSRPGAIVYTREPWGTAASGPRFFVTGAAGSVEPQALLIAAYGATEAARGLADADGGFLVDLGLADRSVLSLRAVDAAGNASPAADVKDVEWRASLQGKVPGSLAENPHTLLTRPVFTESVEDESSVEQRMPLRLDGQPRWTRERGNFAWDQGCAFHAARRRSVVWGGFGTYTNDMLEWDGQRFAQSLPKPAATQTSGRVYEGAPLRSEPALTYDSRRSRVLVFGGGDWFSGSAVVNELWAWDGLKWADVSPDGGVRPAPRSRAAIAYDSARDVVVVYGGALDGGFRAASDELWEYANGAWTERTQRDAGWPAVVYAPAMVFDSRRGVTVLQTGTQTWEWDGGSLRQRTTTGPLVRETYPMVFDSARGKVVLFAGADTYSNSLWEWDGTSWTNRSGAPGAPPSRWLACVTYDAARGRTVVIAGQDAVTRSYRSDVYEWDGTSWTNPLPEDPLANSYQYSEFTEAVGNGVALDTARGRLVTWATQVTGSGPMPGPFLTEYRLNAWRAMPLDGGPRPFLRSAATYDSARQVSVFFGGLDDAGVPLDQHWEWDGGALVAFTGPRPEARFAHALAYDASRRRVVLFGGRSDAGALGSTWEFDGQAWADRTPAAGSPAPRWGHAMTYDDARRRTVLFGGATDAGLSSETWEWDGLGWSRAALPPDAGPRGRVHAGFGYDALRHRAVLFGGVTRLGAGTPASPFAAEVAAEHWEWDGAAWTRIVGLAPSQRWGNGIAYDPASLRLLMTGGLPKDPNNDRSYFVHGLGYEAGDRPFALYRVAFTYAGEPAAVLQSLRVEVAGGATGSDVDGGARPGVELYAYEPLLDAFTRKASSGAADSAPSAIAFGVDGGAALLFGPRAEVLFGVAPVGGNSRSVPVRLRVDDAVLAIRYRRP